MSRCSTTTGGPSPPRVRCSTVPAAGTVLLVHSIVAISSLPRPGQNCAAAEACTQMPGGDGRLATVHSFPARRFSHPSGLAGEASVQLEVLRGDAETGSRGKVPLQLRIQWEHRPTHIAESQL